MHLELVQKLKLADGLGCVLISLFDDGLLHSELDIVFGEWSLEALSEVLQDCHSIQL